MAGSPHAVREIEAEPVAFCVAGRASLAPASADHLRGYVREVGTTGMDMDLIVRAAGRIQRVAKAHYGTMRVKPGFNSWSAIHTASQ